MSRNFENIGKIDEISKIMGDLAEHGSDIWVAYCDRDGCRRNWALRDRPGIGPRSPLSLAHRRTGWEHARSFDPRDGIKTMGWGR